MALLEAEQRIQEQGMIHVSYAEERAAMMGDLAVNVAAVIVYVAPPIE